MNIGTKPKWIFGTFTYVGTANVKQENTNKVHAKNRRNNK